MTTFQRMVLRGEESAPHIPPQTDPTVGLLRNMWRSSRVSANHQKATDFLLQIQIYLHGSLWRISLKVYRMTTFQEALMCYVGSCLVLVV